MMSVSTIAVFWQLLVCTLIYAYTLSMCGGGAKKEEKDKSSDGDSPKSPAPKAAGAVPAKSAEKPKIKPSAEKKSNMDGGDGNYEDYTITGPPPQQA